MIIEGIFVENLNNYFVIYLDEGRFPRIKKVILHSCTKIEISKIGTDYDVDKWKTNLRFALIFVVNDGGSTVLNQQLHKTLCHTQFHSH